MTVFVVAMLVLVTRNMAFVAGKSSTVSSSTSLSTVSGGVSKMSSIKSAGFSLDSAVMGALYAPIGHRLLFMAIAAALMFIRGASMGGEAAIILVLLAIAYVASHVTWTALMVDGQSGATEDWFYPWVHPILVVSATMYSLVAFAASQSVVGFVVTMAIWMFLVAGEFAMGVLLKRYNPMQVLRTLKAKPGAVSVAIWSTIAAIVVAAGILVAYFILARVGFDVPAFLVIAGVIFLLAVGIPIAFWSEIAKKFAGGGKPKAVNPVSGYTKANARLGENIAWTDGAGPVQFKILSADGGTWRGTVSIVLGKSGLALEIQDPDGTNGKPGPTTSKFTIVPPANSNPSAGLIAWKSGKVFRQVVGSLQADVAMRGVRYSASAPIVIEEAEIDIVVTEEEVGP